MGFTVPGGFSTSSAVSLCLPTPCLAGGVGESISGQGGRVLVENHWDSVQATNNPCNHFSKGQDYIKMMLYNLCKKAGLPVGKEVNSIPQGWSRQVRKEQAETMHHTRPTHHPHSWQTTEVSA